MNRPFNPYLLGIVALLGVALVSSCGTRPDVNEDNASRVETSPPLTLLPTSTIGSSSGKVVSVTRTTDVSQHAESPVLTSTVDLTNPEVTKAPSQKDVSDVSISPLPTSTVGSSKNGAIPVYTYEIVNTFPHDRDAFTQGLVYVEDVLYEGTGRQGKSNLRTVELETGNVLRLHRLPVQLFGEGVTVLGDKVFQLTWKAHVGFIYDKDSFELLQVFTYPTEGWGLTHDGQRLIMSDGTSTLHFLDPETLEEIGRVEVYDNNGPVLNLNELEYIDGEVYANVWKTDRIARIDPETGQVTGWIDLTGLLTEQDRSQPVDVLNGIAYDAENDRLFVTGKLWPKMFQIELVPETAGVK